MRYGWGYINPFFFKSSLTKLNTLDTRLVIIIFAKNRYLLAYDVTFISSLIVTICNCAWIYDALFGYFYEKTFNHNEAT